MHHAAVQGVAHAVDDEGIDNETRIRRHIRNRTSPFFDVIDGDAPRCVPVPGTGYCTVMNRDKFRYPMLVYLQEAPRARKRTVHRTVPVKMWLLESSSTSCTC